MKIIDEFSTTSDLGGVLVGNTDWQVLVPNGYGDGTTEVHIIRFKDFEEQLEYVMDKETGKHHFDYFTVVKGHFGIYPYDAYKIKLPLRPRRWATSGPGRRLFSPTGSESLRRW